MASSAGSPGVALLLFLVFLTPVLLSGDLVFLPAVLDSAAAVLGAAGFAGAAAGLGVAGFAGAVFVATATAAAAFPAAATSFLGGISDLVCELRHCWLINFPLRILTRVSPPRAFQPAPRLYSYSLLLTMLGGTKRVPTSSPRSTRVIESG